MYGHVPQYLDVERQRLRAERAERLANVWRITSLILLGLLIGQGWVMTP